MTPDEYREANSYTDSDGERKDPLRLCWWDLLVPILTAIRHTISTYESLIKGHVNQRIEREAVAMEMWSDLESIR